MTNAIELRPGACLIDGRWRMGERRLPVENPATGEVVGHVPDMGAAEAAEAVDAAARAFPGWAKTLADERARLLMRYFQLIEDHAEALAGILTAEQGKPLAEARGEIGYAASFIRWFAEEARRAYGEVVPPHAADKRILVIPQPIGVVGAITPWNFPAAMVTRKIAPALAAGCTVVLKPAEQTPMTALALGALAQAAGLPAGVLNIVTGDPVAIGGVLTASPIVRKITFTGSTPVGALLFAQSSATIKKLSLELGGNAPFLVFDDADLDAAVEGAVASKYRNAGQTCVSANRFYVQSGIHDAFVTRLAERTQSLVVGTGDDPQAQIGPLIDEDAVAKVEAHIADALAQGATIVTGGKRHARSGQFFEPTVLAGVTSTMQVVRDETFGPVAPVVRFDTEEEAIALANASESGLAGYFYARDISRIWRVAEALEVGMVGINTGLISTEVAPFGGVKQSGLGREGSRHGLADYMELKYLCMGI